MKKLLFALLLATGVTRFVAWVNRSRVVILCYHSVTNRIEPTPNDPFKLHLPLGLFLKQLDHLQSNYHVISLREFIRAQREKTPLPSHSLVLTFDDGFRNFNTVVAPVLLQRGLRAAVFIVTDKTSDNSTPNSEWNPKDDRTFLTWAEVYKLAQLDFEVGSHSCSHARLSSLSAEAAQKEIEDSRAALINQLGHDGFPLAYPHGETSEVINRLAQSVGYSCGLTTALGRNGSDSDLFALRRTVVASSDDVATFAARVAGVTWWSNKLMGWFSSQKSESRASQNQHFEPLLPNLDL